MHLHVCVCMTKGCVCLYEEGQGYEERGERGGRERQRQRDSEKNRARARERERDRDRERQRESHAHRQTIGMLGMSRRPETGSMGPVTPRFGNPGLAARMESSSTGQPGESIFKSSFGMKK